MLSHNADLFAGTVITKEMKEPNIRVLLGALLFGCIVSFVVCNLCLGTYLQKLSYAAYSVIYVKFHLATGDQYRIKNNKNNNNDKQTNKETSKKQIHFHVQSLYNIFCL